MTATQFRLACTAAVLALAGCAHHETEDCRGCTTVYLEGGQLAIAHFVPADPAAVDRVAAAYCQEHRMGKPEITKHPELQKYSHWAVYLFACEDPDAEADTHKNRQDRPGGQAAAPSLPAAPPASAQAPLPAPAPAVAAPPAAPVNAQKPVDIEAAKLGATCTGLGFQKETPEYGNCVLKLMEFSRAQAEQLRQQQRVPTLTTIRLQNGDILTCKQAGDQLSCK